MQNAEFNDCPDADVARTGHERATPTPTDGVEEGERLVASEANPARGEQDRIAQTGEEVLEPEVGHTHTKLTPSSRTIVSSIAYSGPLPPASEMQAYDEETRKHILDMHRMQIEHSIRQDDRITDEVIESDRQQSRREDLLVQADIDQSQKAQDKTFVIYLALIATLVVAVVLGQSQAAVAIAALIGGVSITNMFVSLTSHGHRTTKELQKPKDDGGGQEQ